MGKFEFALALLATDRLTQLVTEDEITRPIREGVQRRWPDSKVSYLIGCRACVSIWSGLVVSSGAVPRRVLLALALSSAVLFGDRQDERIGALITTYRRTKASSDGIRA